MVSLFACGESAFLSVLSRGRVAFSNNDTGVKTRAIIPIMLFPSQLYSQVCKPGSITTSPPNEFGEKECFHHNVKGTLFFAEGISMKDPCANYSNKAYWLRSQVMDPSGKIMSFPYTTIASMSSIMEDKDATKYVYTSSPKRANRLFDQTITWKRCWGSCYASFYTAKNETYNPLTGNVSSRNWVAELIAYNYGKFPVSISTSAHYLRGTDFSQIPTREQMLKSITPDWIEILSPQTKGYVLPFKNMPNSLDVMSRAATTLRAVAHDPNFRLRFGRKPPVEWGDLCEQAINDCHVLDVNSLSFSRDLLCLVPQLKALVSLLGSMNRARKFASLYLSYRYGIALTVSDSKEIMKRVHALRDSALNPPVAVVRSMSGTSVQPGAGQFTNITSRQWYKIYYHPVDGRVMKIMRSLLDWDIYPTFQNLWDLVPFSFVVDWFVDVESLMDKMDVNAYLPYLEVRAVTRTRKDVCTVEPAVLGVSAVGTLEVILYERTTDCVLDLPRIKLDQPKKFDNWAELTAIILQKKG